MPFTNPTDIARLGHRFQLYARHANATGGAREIVASRIQRFDPNVNHNTEVHHELGTVDPVGFSSESPRMRISFEELVHSVAMDLLMAGQADSATTWNLGHYLNNGDIRLSLLERTNADVVAGESEYDGCVITEVAWEWRVQQAVTARYTVEGRLGKRYKTGSTPHTSWGAQDTTSPGAIKAKDARLFLGGTGATARVFRIQGMTLRCQLRATPVSELGSRALVGYVVEPPDAMLDVDVAVADEQPDSTLFEYNGSSYYDYGLPVTIATSAIRIYDPEDAEATTVLRAWKLENLVINTATPTPANVRGLNVKRYSMPIYKATTAGSAGVIGYLGDIA
jgi:hypothetical protein